MTCTCVHRQLLPFSVTHVLRPYLTRGRQGQRQATTDMEKNSSHPEAEATQSPGHDARNKDTQTMALSSAQHRTLQVYDRRRRTPPRIEHLGSAIFYTCFLVAAQMFGRRGSNWPQIIVQLSCPRTKHHFVYVEWMPMSLNLCLATHLSLRHYYYPMVPVL